MKQEQLIAYSLILFIVIPLLVTTLGGMLILKGSAGFFPYAKFLFGLTISLGLLLFTLKNFRTLFAFIYIVLISLFHTYTLRNSLLFPDVSLIMRFMLVFLFFAGLLLCIRLIFLNTIFKSIRTLLFSFCGAIVFITVFLLMHSLAKNPIQSQQELMNDFSIGFMLFATLGIGFLLTDIILNAIADRFHLKPSLLSVKLIDDEILDVQDLDKDEDD